MSKRKLYMIYIPPITTKQNVQKQNKDKPNTHIL